MKTEWVHKKLGDCCERICNGLTYDVEETQGYFVTRIETISDGYIDYNKIGHINDKPNQDYLMVNGDILFSHINSVKHIGKVAYYDDSTELYHGMNLLLLRANNNIDKLFLFYLLSSDKYRRKIRALAKSAVNQASISTTDLGKFEISYPASLTAQRRIAAILASADKVIAATQKTIAKYKQIKQGMMEDLLKPKEGWKMVKLGECCETELGKTLDEGRNTGQYRPYLCALNVLWGKIDITTIKQMRIEDSELERYLVKKGDLLVCEGGEIGRCAIWNSDDEIYYQNALHRVRFYNEFEPMFFMYLLCYYNDLRIIEKYGKGLTIKHLNQTSFRNIPVSVPVLTEQRRIASILSGIDAKIAAEEKVLEKYEKVKKGLMERMLNE